MAVKDQSLLAAVGPLIGFKQEFTRSVVNLSQASP
jgi:hypothetical protein